LIYLISLLISLSSAQTSLPLSPDSLQLQALIKTSQEQLALIKQLLEQGQRDGDTLNRAMLALNKLSQGVDQSLEKYQGSAAYQQALLMVQSQAKPEQFGRFQQAAENAARADLEAQENLNKALLTAGPGFVPKIQAQAQIGSWRSNTRVSAQLAELVTEVHELKNEMQGRGKSAFDFSALIKGSEYQSQKQREVRVDEPK
jgi:hypothetical protein